MSRKENESLRNPSRLTELANRARGLVKAPRASGDWYRIANQADRAEVYIYGIIGSDFDEGVTAASFVRDLRAIDAPSIDLHINSPGGLVWDGVAIYSALLNHDATVNVYVDGVAASAASFVAMAGDTRTIEKPARMFVHDAHALAIGNAALMRETADVLDELSDTIAGIYADRAGGQVADWRAAMKRETWYSAAQAVDAGLADRVNGQMADQASAPDNRGSQLIRARARVRSMA